MRSDRGTSKPCTPAALAALLALAAPAGLACSIPDPDAHIALDADGGLPDFGQFAGDAPSGGVHVFLEKSCGTLDCHGQMSRPLRLYSANGMREPDSGLVPGVEPETDAEIHDNYLSVVGLQPEEMLRVRLPVGGDLPNQLLLIQKPLGAENSDNGGVSHKGGTKITPQGDPAVCLVGWLGNGTTRDGRPITFDQGACAAADQLP
jgi:hypothetical protein